MATSGTIYTRWDSAGTNYDLYRFYLAWQEASQDIPNNSTLVKWQAGVEIKNNGYLGSNATTINSIHINGGSSLGSGTWSSISGNGNHQLKSGSKSVDHNSDGTKTFGLDISGSFIGDGAFSASGSYTLPTIPRNSQVTTNDSGHYTLGTPLNIYTNRKSSSFTHTITIRQASSSGTVIHTFNSVGSSVTWTPSSDEITTMQAMIPNSNSLSLYIDQYNNQVKEHSHVYVTSYLTDANPVFTTFTYKDSDSTTTSITGNDQVLVKGKSVLEVDIATANKMAAVKSATADHYAIAYDGSSEIEAYSSSATVSASFSNLQTIGTRTIQVTAYDSRNNATKAAQDVTVYDYAAPTITTTLSRENNFGSDTTVHIEGTYTPLVIGGANKNSLTTSTLQYRYQEDGGTFGSWVTKTFTANTTAGTFSVTDFVVSLDNTKKYNFEFHINDSFGQVTSTNSVDVGTPIMFVGQNSGVAAVGINKMPVNGMLDVAGSIYANGQKLVGLGSIVLGKSTALASTVINSTTTFADVSGVSVSATIPDGISCVEVYLLSATGDANVSSGSYAEYRILDEDNSQVAFTQFRNVGSAAAVFPLCLGGVSNVTAGESKTYRVQQRINGTGSTAQLFSGAILMVRTIS